MKENFSDTIIKGNKTVWDINEEVLRLMIEKSLICAGFQDTLKKYSFCEGFDSKEQEILNRILLEKLNHQKALTLRNAGEGESLKTAREFANDIAALIINDESFERIAQLFQNANEGSKWGVLQEYLLLNIILPDNDTGHIDSLSEFILDQRESCIRNYGVEKTLEQLIKTKQELILRAGEEKIGALTKGIKRLLRRPKTRKALTNQRERYYRAVKEIGKRLGMHEKPNAKIIGRVTETIVFKSIPEKDLEIWRDRLKRLGINIKYIIHSGMNIAEFGFVPSEGTVLLGIRENHANKRKCRRLFESEDDRSLQHKVNFNFGKQTLDEIIKKIPYEEKDGLRR